MLDGLKGAVDSFVKGFMLAVYVWLAVVVLNAVLGLLGLAVVLALPAAVAWMLNPFVLGPVLGVLKVVLDHLKS